MKEYVQRTEFELYAIDKDPHESKNLAYDPEYKELLEQYKKKMQDWQKANNDPWILKWKYE